MSFTVIKLPDEPIILIRLQLDKLADEDASRTLRAQIVRYRDASDDMLYMVWDLGKQDVTAGDIQLLLYDAQTHTGGTVADSRLRTVIVSLHPVVAILRRKVRQQFGVALWQFPTLDEAFDWIRAQRTLDAGPDTDDESGAV